MESLASTDLVHVFQAAAFVENLSLKDLAAVYPEARRRPHELFYRVEGGAVFIYPFGAIVFRDLAEPVRERELERLRRARPGLTRATVIEELNVRVHQGAGMGLALARTAARAMGGDVVIETSSSAGSTFLWTIALSS